MPSLNINSPILRVSTFITSLFITSHVFGQISPPGLDNTNAASWGAIAVNQRIAKRWSTTIYTGAARESDPDNFSLLHKPAIFVLNQETQYRFNDYWQISFCNSFRLQNRYDEAKPYDPENPPLREELRYYVRLFYRKTFGKTTGLFSFRPEYRSYYAAHMSKWYPVPTELRFRFKAQAFYPLNKSKSNQFIIANEWLTATDHIRENNILHWSHLAYTEDRLTTFLRHTFKKPDVIIDIGVMHQIRSNGDYIAHLSFDIIFQNPITL